MFSYFASLIQQLNADTFFFYWKIAAIIAEGHETGAPSPVVYVSGEEVGVLLSRVECC